MLKKFVFIIIAVIVAFVGFRSPKRACAHPAGAMLAVGTLALSGAGYAIADKPGNAYAYMDPAVPRPKDALYGPHNITISGRETDVIMCRNGIIYAGVNKPFPTWIPMKLWVKWYGKLSRHDFIFLVRCFPNLP